MWKRTIYLYCRWVPGTCAQAWIDRWSALHGLVVIIMLCALVLFFIRHRGLQHRQRHGGWHARTRRVPLMFCFTLGPVLTTGPRQKKRPRYNRSTLCTHEAYLIYGMRHMYLRVASVRGSCMILRARQCVSCFSIFFPGLPPLLHWTGIVMFLHMAPLMERG